jgi:hypothetical protein
LCGRLLRKQWSCAKDERSAAKQDAADISKSLNGHRISSEHGEGRPVLLDLYSRHTPVRQACAWARNQ